jgi:hypothetical protein
MIALIGSGVIIGMVVPAAPQPAREKIHVVTPYAKFGGSRDVDVGKHGPSVGDYGITRAPAFKVGTTKPVGWDRDECVLILVKAQVYDCHGTFKLPRGRITFEGVASFKKGRGTHAITGGTGAYRNAGGALKVYGTRRALHHVFFLTLNTP